MLQVRKKASGGAFTNVRFGSKADIELRPSALPPKADIAVSDWHVRFVPKADIGIGSNPDIILGCALAALVSRIQHATRLNQQ